MRDDETILKLYSEDRYGELTVDEKLRLLKIYSRDKHLHNN